MMKKYSMEIQDAIRFYEGDVRKNGHPFFSDDKAYVTWNALLFPGIETELARTNENRLLNPACIDYLEELVDYSKDLICAMKKVDTTQHVRRVEREVDYHMFVKQQCVSTFLSTSTSGFLDAYTDKIDLVLLEVYLHPGTLAVSFSEVLDTYVKETEQEICAAPFQRVEVRELKMDESLHLIHDGNQNPVKVYARMDIYPTISKNTSSITLNPEVIESAKRCYASWNSHQQPDKKDIELYLDCKRWFQAQVYQAVYEKSQC